MKTYLIPVAALALLSACDKPAEPTPTVITDKPAVVAPAAGEKTETNASVVTPPAPAAADKPAAESTLPAPAADAPAPAPAAPAAPAAAPAN